MEEDSQPSDQSIEQYRLRLNEFKKRKDKHLKERILEDIPEDEKFVVGRVCESQCGP